MQPSDTKKAIRPPSDRGQGRKKLPDDQRKSVRSVRLSDAHWEAYKELGGTSWLEPAIDKAAVAKRKRESPPS